MEKNGIVIPDEIASNMSDFQVSQAFAQPTQDLANSYIAEIFTKGNFDPVTSIEPLPKANEGEKPAEPTEPETVSPNKTVEFLKRLMPEGDLHERGKAVVILCMVVSLAYIAYHFIELNTGRNAVPKNLLPAYDRMVREEKASRIRYEAAKACHALRSVGGTCEIQ